MINRDEIQVSAKTFAKREEVNLLEVLKGYVITTDEQNEEAAEFVKMVKRAHKDIDAAKDAFTAPLREARAWVDAQFNPMLIRLKNAENSLKQMIGAYAARQQAEQRRLAAKAAELAPKAVTREAFTLAMASVQAAAPAKVQGVSTRTVTRFRYVDRDAVPREFCSPDDKLVGEAVAAGRAIPGVEVYEEQIVSVRTGS